MDRWPEIERVLDQALDLAPEQRSAFLERTCSTDPELRAAVERLLRGTEAADSFLGEPAAAYAAPLVAWVGARQELAPGTPFGCYEVVRQLGRGGMATVYLAQDHKHHRAVAIKVLHPELAAAVGPERFLREIQIAAALHHPHILPLYDSGVTDGLLFYAMPHIEGESLRQRLTREEHLGIADAVRIAQEVASALDYAHRQGVVHRDIKPENILLQDGQAIVADFGIARAIDAAGVERLTEPGPGIGTPAYMSPEQGSSDTVIDGRADIYALGCVLYEVLAGQPPFTGRSRQQILARHAIDPVPSLHTVRQTVPPALERAVTCALAKLPADRFATAGEFAQALDGAASATMPQRPGLRLRQRGLVLGVAAVTILTAGIGYLLRRAPGSTGSNPGLVAILPFRIAGASPELAWLREGLVDLLTIKLSSEGGLRTVEPASVLNAWRRVAGSASKETTPDAALAIARGLGAGRVIDGNVVGTPGHLTLTAGLLTTPGGQSAARASAEGPVDSLSMLVDRLAAQLLTLDAGVDAARLPGISSSLPATRAFLMGRAAFREARFDEAFRQFREATVLDSTFALAALELVLASRWVEGGGWGKDAERGKRLAQAGRNRLGPGDRALLDIWIIPSPTSPEWIQGWQAASSAYPDRAETWYGLGDAYYHNGMLVGLDDPLRLAAEAFQRGWAIDSANGADSPARERSIIVAEPLMHMVEIAQIKGDTASVRRLVALGLAADTGRWYLRWHRAVALGDSAQRAFWADSQRIAPWAFGIISEFMTWTGLGSQDLLRATRLDTRKVEAGNPGAVSSSHASALLNGGRPREALRALHIDDTSTVDLRGRVYDALYWGGDTTAAAQAARRLGPYAAGAARLGESGRTQLLTLCALTTWHAAHGDYRYTEAAIGRLRGASITGLSSFDSIALTRHRALCAALLEATRAGALRLPEARAKLAQADAAARIYVIWARALAANLVIARLAEAQGDLALALRAVRRRGERFGMFPFYLSTFLREEGRLAALTGDTAGAIRAYQHYLALRPNPEPEVKPEVERVREGLARLLGRRSR